MDYKGQAYMLRRHYIDNIEGIVFQNINSICKDCNLAATSITDLLASAEAAEDRAEKAEEENRKLRDIMVQLRKTERPEKCSVVFEMTYLADISEEQLGNVAEYVFRGLMKADSERRNKCGAVDLS